MLRICAFLRNLQKHTYYIHKKKYNKAFINLAENLAKKCFNKLSLKRRYVQNDIVRK